MEESTSPIDEKYVGMPLSPGNILASHGFTLQLPHMQIYSENLRGFKFRFQYEGRFEELQLPKQKHPKLPKGAKTFKSKWNKMEEIQRIMKVKSISSNPQDWSQPATSGGWYWGRGGVTEPNSNKGHHLGHGSIWILWHPEPSTEVLAHHDPGIRTAFFGAGGRKSWTCQARQTNDTTMWRFSSCLETLVIDCCIWI